MTTVLGAPRKGGAKRDRGKDCGKEAGKIKNPFDTGREPSSLSDASVEGGFLVHPDGYASHAKGEQP